MLSKPVRDLDVRRSLRFTVVIVLYKVRAEDAPAYRTLRASLAAATMPHEADVVLFDNTPGLTVGYSTFPDAHYVKASGNEGIAGAYNYALARAEVNGSDWLLTLDQDTELPVSFLDDMLLAVSMHSADPGIAAVVPQLFDGTSLLSPSVVHAWGSSRVPEGFCGNPAGEVHAFNSGSMFRIAALKEIGAFHPDFWLDFLDEWVYANFHRAGLRVWVVGTVRAEHELSVMDFANRVSSERFANLLDAECAYMDLYATALGSALYDLRVCARLYSVNKRKRGKAIVALTWELLRRRLLWTRSQRLRRWRDAMRKRNVSGQEAALRAPAATAGGRE